MNIVSSLIDAGAQACALLRSEITEVSMGPILGDVEHVDFVFRGMSYSLPLPNPDYVVCGDGRESDKSIALRALLRNHA